MITSAANPQVKALRTLASSPRKRREEGVFLAEGPRMVMEAPADLVKAIYCSASYLEEHGMEGLPERLIPEILSDSLFHSLSDTVTPQGVLAVIRRQEHSVEELLKSGKTLVILESIQDPGNLGTILRTGEAAGIGGVLMNRGTVDLYNPKTVRSTMGALFRVPCVVAEDFLSAIAGVKSAGYRLFAAHLNGSVPYDEADYGSRPAAFLIGNEGQGLSEEAVSLADACVRIPMQGKVESLNAAVAAALLMYEAARKK